MNFEQNIQWEKEIEQFRRNQIREVLSGTDIENEINNEIFDYMQNWKEDHIFDISKYESNTPNVLTIVYKDRPGDLKTRLEKFTQKLEVEWADGPRDELDNKLGEYFENLLKDPEFFTLLAQIDPNPEIFKEGFVYHFHEQYRDREVELSLENINYEDFFGKDYDSQYVKAFTTFDVWVNNEEANQCAGLIKNHLEALENIDNEVSVTLGEDDFIEESAYDLTIEPNVGWETSNIENSGEEMSGIDYGA